MKTLIYCVDPSWKVSLKRGVDTFVPKCQHQKLVEVAGFLKFKPFPYETLLGAFLLFPSLFGFGKNVCGEKMGVKYFLRRKKCICNNEFEETFANHSTLNKISFVKKKWGRNFPCAEKMHMLFVILNLRRLFANNSTSKKYLSVPRVL